MKNAILVKSLLLVMVCGCMFFPIRACADEVLTNFESDEWVLYNAEVVEHLGRKCLIGSAYMPNINFENGIIEFDIAVTGARSYPGISIRGTSQLDYEHFYIRPHLHNLPDGLQYTSNFGGASGWQLYNGAGYSATIPIPHDEWIHIRLEILGKRARIFYGEGDTPDLVINDLKHDVRQGPIGILSNRNMAACFSNFRVTVTDDLNFGPAPVEREPRGMITEWDLSQPFKAAALKLDAYPDKGVLKTVEWSSVSAEAGGLLDISRHVRRSVTGEADVVLLKTTINAARGGLHQYAFGYSDVVTVFLNGKPLFTGNASYRSRSLNFAGIISPNDVLHLPLKRGDNELLVVLAEIFGGWGLIVQDMDDDLLPAGAKQVWQHETTFRSPECALYDAARDILYVTNYFSGGNEFISRVRLDGEVEDLEWISGLVRPTGLFIEGDTLWAVDRTNLIKIDIVAGTILERIPVPGAAFPNDVSGDAVGNLYVSDTDGGKLYRYTGGAFEIWLEGEDVSQPNGMLVDGNRLLYGNGGDGCLKSADLRTKEVRTVFALGDGANPDGLRPDGRGGYLVSDFNNRIFHVSSTGEGTLLFDTSSSHGFSADFEYIPDEGLIVVPGLYDNKLTAYKVRQF
ncbi:MAG: hypothetical protein GY835_16770 [bacterium]|nr:hypothetical protein [bacterium]